MLETVQGEIVGASEEANRLRQFVAEAARSMAPVTFTGEPGTGKKVAARLIHECSARSRGPFLMVDCSLFFDRELKRELFGYVASGSQCQKSRKGLLEFASKGTCYLSRVEELSPSIQSSLLALLRTGKFARLGDGKAIATEVRIITSSSKNLGGFVEAGLFDKALFHELMAMSLHLSPLRDRSGDVATIVESLLRRKAAESARGAHVTLTAEALQALAAYPWPGNLDELEGEILRLCGAASGLVGPEQLALEISSHWLGRRGDPEVRKVLDELDGHIREFRVLSRLDLSYGELVGIAGSKGVPISCSPRDSFGEP